MRISWIALILATVATAASAAEWEFVTISAKDSAYFIDRSSVRTASDVYGSYKMAWFKTDDSQNKSVKYRSSMLLYRAKCNAYELGLAQWIDYDANGVVLDSNTSNYVKYQVVAPETVGYSILSAICWPADSIE